MITIDKETIMVGPISEGQLISATLAFVPVRPGSVTISWFDGRGGHTLRVMDDAEGKLVGHIEEDFLPRNKINYETGEIAVALSRKIKEGIPVNVTYDAEVEEGTPAGTWNKGRCKRCGGKPRIGDKEGTIYEWQCQACNAVLCEHQVRIAAHAPKDYLVHEVFGVREDEEPGGQECGPVLPRGEAPLERIESVVESWKKVMRANYATSLDQVESAEEELSELIDEELELEHKTSEGMVEMIRKKVRDKFKGIL